MRRLLDKLPPIGPRGQKALKIAGYVLAGLISFVYALHLTFPYHRLKDKGVEWLSKSYDVQVGGVERGWMPGDFSLTKVQLRTRPSKPGEVPKLILIDRLDIDVAVLSVVFGSVDVELDAKIGPGRITGELELDKSSVQASLHSRNLPLSDVPGLDSIIGMPMGGRGNVNARIHLPGNDWRRASARLTIDCPMCTVGGEGAFFKPRNTTSRTAAFAGEGVAVPELTITSLRADWSIEKGKIKTNKFEFLSPHLAVQLDFEADVAKSITDSKIDSGCLRYRGTDELKKLDEKFYNALELTGGPLGGDDLRHLKLVGTLGKFKALGKECGAGAGEGEDAVGADTGRPRPRPNLDAVPEPGTGAEPAATTGTLDVQPAAGSDAAPAGAPGDAMPTPKVDDVRKLEEAPANGGAPPADGAAVGPNGEPPPPEGTPRSRGELAPELPASAADSAHPEGTAADGSGQPQQPPPENE